MGIEKGLVAVAGVVFIGFVGYKVIRKMRPEMMRKTGKTLSGITQKSADFIEGAKHSFREGYARA